MATATVSFRSSSLLDCAPCGGDAVICINRTLIVANMPFLAVTISAVNETWDVYGKKQYVYEFTYDSTLVTRALVPEDITGAFCDGCLKTYIDALSSPSWEYIFNQSQIDQAVLDTLGGPYSVDDFPIFVGPGFAPYPSSRVPKGPYDDMHIPVWRTGSNAFVPYLLQELLNSPSAGDFIGWDGAAFVHPSLSDMLGTPSAGDIITYNGAACAPQTIHEILGVAWAAWTPTVGQAPTGTAVLTVDTLDAHYFVIGRLCFWKIGVTGHMNAGTGVLAGLSFTLPLGVTVRADTYWLSPGTPAVTAYIGDPGARQHLWASEVRTIGPVIVFDAWGATGPFDAAGDPVLVEGPDQTCSAVGSCAFVAQGFFEMTAIL